VELTRGGAQAVANAPKIDPYEEEQKRLAEEQRQKEEAERKAKEESRNRLKNRAALFGN
jgi:ribosomal protein L12E/L44/L45/RPP1/RPP2